MADLYSVYGPLPVLPIEDTLTPVTVTGALTLLVDSVYMLTALGSNVTISEQYLSPAAAPTASFNMAPSQTIFIHTQNNTDRIAVTIGASSSLQVAKLKIS